MNKLFVPAALLLGSTSFSVAQAETIPSTIVVTASRTAQTVDETLASVTVIDREEIERKQATSVAELLSTAPGVSIANNGGRGKTTSVFLRGTSSDHVLVLIDGIKAGSATSGGFSFQHLSPDQIDHIEIVRGPRSSLYGSEAIGGVIQIFTRKGTQGLTPRFSAGTGSNDSREVTAGLSAGNEQGWFSADISDYSTDGFNAKTEGSSGYDPDNDGYDNTSFALNGGYRLSDWASAQLHWTRNEGDSEYDGGADNSSESELEALGGTLSLTPSDSWALDLSLGRSKDESAEYEYGEYESHIDTERDTASVVSKHYLNESNELTWGVDYQEDKVDSGSVDSDAGYKKDSRDNTGVFGLYQLYFGAQDLAFSLRTDDNEQFGRHNTGSIAWGIQVDPNLRLFASYGTAFKAPTFNDLYWPGSGNENLNPEESESWELGLSGLHAGINWSANLYQNDIENMIDWVNLSGTYTPMNVSEARIRGLELQASKEVAGWALVTSIDLKDPKNREDDSLLDNLARKELNISADRDFGVWSAGASLQAVGKRKDGSENLGGYTLLGLRGAYKLNRDWSLRANVSNLLDENYQTVADYNQPDREFWLSINYTPGS